MAAKTNSRTGRKLMPRHVKLPEEVVRNLFSRYLDRNREFYREEPIEALFA